MCGGRNKWIGDQVRAYIGVFVGKAVKIAAWRRDHRFTVWALYMQSAWPVIIPACAIFDVAPKRLFTRHGGSRGDVSTRTHNKFNLAHLLVGLLVCG